MSEATAAATNDALPSSARAVIVGAGIVGASVVHHLAREGWTDLVIIDQGPLWETGGSTSHAPGLVFQLNPSHTMTQLARATVDLLSGLELDGLPCYHPVGGIEVAATEERWAELDRRYGRARGYGLDAALLSPGEVAERDSAHRPRPHRRRPARRARRDREGRPRRRGDGPGGGRGGRRAGVRLDRGDRARRRGRPRARRRDDARHDRDRAPSSSCAGIWGPKAARMLGGVRVPLVPVQHQYAYTAPLPELAGETREVVHPILRHQDHSMYFRQHADAYGIGNYRHEPRLTEPEDIRPVGGEMQPSMLPFTDEDFATAARETASLLPAVGRAAADAHVQRADVVHARRLPAAGRDRRRSAGCGSARRSGSRTRAGRARRSPSS